MENIKLENINLENVIIALEKDNETINEIIKNTNDAIRTLDESEWKSTEKEKMDESWNPYMQKIENYMSYLNECTSLLREASLTYQNTTSSLQQKIGDIDTI